jgi:hypothetical protein
MVALKLRRRGAAGRLAFRDLMDGADANELPKELC